MPFCTDGEVDRRDKATTQGESKGTGDTRNIFLLPAGCSGQPAAPPPAPSYGGTKAGVPLQPTAAWCSLPNLSACFPVLQLAWTKGRKGQEMIMKTWNPQTQRVWKQHCWVCAFKAVLQSRPQAAAWCCVLPAADQSQPLPLMLTNEIENSKKNEPQRCQTISLLPHHHGVAQLQPLPEELLIHTVPPAILQRPEQTLKCSDEPDWKLNKAKLSKAHFNSE